MLFIQRFKRHSEALYMVKELKKKKEIGKQPTIKAYKTIKIRRPLY